MNDAIFVFGSNLAGRHGKGAALAALRNHGAIYGQPVGLQGQSYAIPTKDQQLRPLSLSTIRISVEIFISFASSTRSFSSRSPGSAAASPGIPTSRSHRSSAMLLRTVRSRTDGGTDE